MSRSAFLPILAAALLLWLLPGAPAARAQATADTATGTDIVTLETGSTSGITPRLAEDLAGLVDDGATRRLLPVLGHGGIDTIADLVQGGAGIDMAILQLDVLNQARSQHLLANLEGNVSYIAKLNYVEFHLLAGPQVNSVEDLAGKPVDVGAQLGNTAVTTAQLFQLLHISAPLTNDPPEIALDKLRRGEIGAIAFVGGKPAPLLRLLQPAGLHLLPVPLTAEIAAAYVPTRLTASDYPGLIPPDAPVNTVAVATGLFVGPVATGSDRYRKLSNVVDAFFTQFQTLLAPGHHPKWAEVNLSAEIPGWHRFAPADDWLKHNAAVVAGQDLRAIFMRFLDDRAKAVGGPEMSDAQKAALFDQFRQWQTTQEPATPQVQATAQPATPTPQSH